MTTIVSWEDVQKFVQNVSNAFKNHSFTGVYGLPRGGCVLAVMLSHSLNIPLLMAPHKGCLIVDDICAISLVFTILSPLTLIASAPAFLNSLINSSKSSAS